MQRVIREKPYPGRNTLRPSQVVIEGLLGSGHHYRALGSMGSDGHGRVTLAEVELGSVEQR